jgi:ACS family hexuronate transporter-like MFS transporter
MLSTAINMLDRQVLAAAAPAIKNELHLSNTGYGAVVSAFGVVYALTSPVYGALIDGIGLSLTVSWAMGLWSVAGIATGFSRSLASLVVCRGVLGAGESAGLPGLAKANALILPSSEFGLSLAANSIAIALGSSAAPLLVAAMAPALGWRSVFFLTGGIGLLWIPLWRVCSQRMPPASSLGVRTETRHLLRDRRLWGLTLSNALIMVVYSVWGNWTTVYFVQQLRLTALQANRSYAWIPPIFATVGGFFGGWLSYRWIQGGMEPARARLRGCWIASAFILVTAAIPFSASPAVAAVLISTAMFWAMSLQMNVHILPVDLFGEEHAGLSVSILAASYGLMQSVVSPAVGAMVDRFGFAAVCIGISVLPLAGVAILKASLAEPQPRQGSVAGSQHA